MYCINDNDLSRSAEIFFSNFIFNGFIQSLNYIGKTCDGSLDFFFFTIFIFFTIDFPPLEIIGLEEEM